MTNILKKPIYQNKKTNNLYFGSVGVLSPPGTYFRHRPKQNSGHLCRMSAKTELSGRPCRMPAKVELSGRLCRLSVKKKLSERLCRPSVENKTIRPSPQASAENKTLGPFGRILWKKE